MQLWFLFVALWLAALLSPISLLAQIASDTPRLISPNGPGGFGVHWLRAETLPGDGDAVLATLAIPSVAPGVRLRGGGGKGVNDEMAGFGGIDVQAPLARSRPGFPLDLDWASGIGVGVGEYFLVTLPVGLSAGVEWSSGSVWMAPYAYAGVAGDLRLGEEAEAAGDEFQVDAALDIGLDLSFVANRTFVLRAATSLGDRQALAIGITVGGGNDD